MTLQLLFHLSTHVFALFLTSLFHLHKKGSCKRKKRERRDHLLVAMETSSLVSSPQVNGVPSLLNSRNKLTLQGVFAYWKTLKKVSSLLRKMMKIGLDREFGVCPSCLWIGSSHAELLQSGLLLMLVVKALAVREGMWFLALPGQWACLFCFDLQRPIYCTTKLHLSCKICIPLLLQVSLFPLVFSFFFSHTASHTFLLFLQLTLFQSILSSPHHPSSLGSSGLNAKLFSLSAHL